MTGCSFALAERPAVWWRSVEPSLFRAAALSCAPRRSWNDPCTRANYAPPRLPSTLRAGTRATPTTEPGISAFRERW